MEFIVNNYMYFILALGLVILYRQLIIFLNIEYDSMVILNIILLSFVSFEPSPSDFVFALLIVFSYKNKNFNLVKSKEYLIIISCLLCFILFNAISILSSADYLKSIRYSFITVYLILYGIFISLYSSIENYTAMLRAYIISSTCAAILGIIGYFGIFASVLTYDQYRTQALFKDPNVFGAFIIPSILILINDLKEKKVIGNNIIMTIGLIAVNGCGLILCFSRGAWASLIFSLSVYFILNFKKVKLLKLSILLSGFAAVVSLIWVKILNSEWKFFLLERLHLQAYDIERFKVQKVGLKLMLSKSLFGYGPGQYEYVVEKIVGSQSSAHSLYTRVMLENGIIGIAFFIIPIVLIVVNLLKNHFKEENCTSIKISVFISIIAGIMLNSYVIDTLHWRHLWFFVGLSLSTISSKKYTHN